MKIYSIGDLHGYNPEDLKKILESKVDLTGENKIVFLGDYCGRGAYEYELLMYLFELQDSNPAGKVILLKGNHEDMVVKNEDTLNLPAFVSEEEKNKILSRLDSLPLYYHYCEGRDVLFVHAGICPTSPVLDKEDRKRIRLRNTKVMLWKDYEPFRAEAPFDYVICGHNTVQVITRRWALSAKPYTDGNGYIYIDTGRGYGFEPAVVCYDTVRGRVTEVVSKGRDKPITADMNNFWSAINDEDY